MFGLLNINKVSGVSSRDAVNRVSQLVGRRIKVGHAGTLDPLATGVLVLCVGPATRLVPWIHDHLKTYEAVFKIGYRSDTEDVDGVIEPVPVPIPLTEERIREHLPDFRGHIQQIPPAHSAIKINGRRAYDIARAGKTVDLEPRDVFINQLHLTECTATEFRLTVECGTGTYIRSLGRDLARKLGTEAVMSSLVRTQVGAFTVEDSISIESLTQENIADALRSPLSLLDHLHCYHATRSDSQKMVWGQRLPIPDQLKAAEGDSVYAVNSEGELVGLLEVQSGRLAPQSIFVKKESFL
ncbi:tRNA pseudouridine(55) synthase TruB [Planctomicrobium sp. SH527]|uniref:tRNA pseudouridine(55) synthase TruB n=1 Tax=Planctomicrobium sp. SH527 TaxID=3448123 RepID=UPI003F5C368A